MNTDRIAAEDFWDYATTRAIRPDHWRGALTRSEAYETQLSVLDRFVSSGVRQGGWKVGATALAVLRQHGLDLDEPLSGYLLGRSRFDSGAVFEYQQMINPGFENELCVTIGRRLCGPDVSFKAACDAISAVQPAIEVIERRVDPKHDINVLIADNLEQFAYVVGPPVPMPTGSRLDRVALDVVVNGEVRASATGAEVLGNPIASVVWLANKLATFGRSLEPDMHIMSGSFTRQFSLNPGDEVEARFHSIGTAALSCR